MKESNNARFVEMLSPAPAMMPDRIGIIGNTQGVNASPSPARKNTPKTSHSEPSSACWKRLSVVLVVTAAGAVDAAEDELAAPAAAAGMATFTVRVITG